MAKYEQNIVVDLEFTSVGKEWSTRNFKNEIIQVGAVRVDPTGKILDSFSSFVKPQFIHRVSRFVQNLTGISTRDVAKGETLDVVLESFRNWIGSADSRFVAWSSTDLKQLQVETAIKEIPFPEQNCKWLDLQKVYPRLMDVGNGRLMALRAAADWYGIKVSEDSLHGALYDARLTAEILASLITEDYLEQKQSLATAINDKSEREATTFSIGSKFSALQQLKAELEAVA